MKLTNRDALIKLREAAYETGDRALSTAWKRAYYRLADALDHCDAIIARTELGPSDLINEMQNLNDKVSSF